MTFVRWVQKLITELWNQEDELWKKVDGLYPFVGANTRMSKKSGIQNLMKIDGVKPTIKNPKDLAHIAFWLLCQGSILIQSLFYPFQKKPGKDRQLFPTPKPFLS